ncbi:hypothetical protein [Ruminiclostridium cellobioparum]|uniref:hypothetical protein n=1 Tax=Ruminiclostridium cellobioparum TaxID=29355 RepID=UPI000686D921|nr:hypothetical protein [Ruminiclostridium cellobioparum]
MPVKKFFDEYEVFEQMHWLCFHLEFEHSNYDPDEPCDDPSCPWNVGKRELMIDIHHDLKIISFDNKSWMDFDFIEAEAERYPSICFKIEIKKNGTEVLKKSIWFEKDALDGFLKALTEFDKAGKGDAFLESMSPEEFSLSIETVDKAGHIVLFYKVKSQRVAYQKMMENSINDYFEIELNQISNILKNLKVF